MNHLPLLSDIEPVRIKYRDGDRVIARVSEHLRADQRWSLQKTIKKFAKAEVRPLIVNCCDIQLTLWRAGRQEVLVALTHIEPTTGLAGKMNLSLATVVFMEGDILEANVSRVDAVQMANIRAELRDWAGSSVEVRVVSRIV